ncbi:MAG TPA: hypothetical protein VH143_27580 [Kofleriaceae bacterium]|nr:hypothetical protein [Kofleriaceae bacterium]
MDSRVDLDGAALEITRRADRWRESGMTLGNVTWRDQADGWPPQLKTNRGDVRDADSIGIRCTKGDREGSLVLFKGGWCDLEYWSGDIADEPLTEAPGYNDWLTVESYGALLDRFFGLFQ